MSESNSRRFFLWRLAVAGLALLLLGPVGPVWATEPFHADGVGREDPWNNCIGCHGADLAGGSSGVSCQACHNDFSEPDPPQPGHHIPGRENPLGNCVLCHGAELGGGMGPSCFSCHEQLWPDPSNSPPTVDPGGPYSALPGEEVQFDASGTSDPDGDPLIYLWDFGDDSPPPFPSQIPTISHTYQNAGTYTARLVVTDGVNQPVVAEVEVRIGVTNQPPSVDPGGPYSGVPGQAVQLDASGTSDPDGDTLLYLWNFGDGSPPQVPSPIATTSHVYQNSGTYTVVLAVTDGVNDPVAAEVSVIINSPPTVDPGGPYSGVAGRAVQFDASGTSDPDGDTLLYQWSFGDGSPPPLPGPTATTSHTYAGAGTYLAVLAVTDGINDPVVAEVEVEISDEPQPPEGDVWDVRVLFAARLTIELEDSAGMLLVSTTHGDGRTTKGFGMELDGFVFWMDVTGSLFIGTIDRQDETMWGIASGYSQTSSFFFAHKIPVPSYFSEQGLFGGIFNVPAF